MSKLILILFFVFTYLNVMQAATFKTFDKAETQISLVLSNEGNRLIRSCLDGKCNTLPSNQAYAYGFDGSDQDWKELFDRCESYEASNTFYFYTDLGASLALFWVPAGIVTKSTKLGKYSQKFIKSLTGSTKVASIATQIGVESGFAIPYDFIGSLKGNPYPDIPEEYIQNSRKTLKLLLNQKTGSLYFSDDVLFAIDQLIKACSHEFNQYKSNELASTCLGSCHGSKNQNKGKS